MELIGLIWDSIPEQSDAQPPEWHTRELDRRISAADKNPELGVPWESVRPKLLEEIGVQVAPSWAERTAGILRWTGEPEDLRRLAGDANCGIEES